jgi:hypothetical protein
MWVLMRVRVHLPPRVVVLARRVWRGISVVRSLGLLLLLLPSPEIENAVRRSVGHDLTISAFPCYYTKILSTPRSDIAGAQLVEGQRVPEICPSLVTRRGRTLCSPRCDTPHLQNPSSLPAIGKAKTGPPSGIRLFSCHIPAASPRALDEDCHVLTPWPFLAWGCGKQSR